MSSRPYRRSAAALAALGVLAGLSTGPAYAADPPGVHWSPLGLAAAGDCTFPSKDVQATPWALQRVLLDQLWQGGVTGKGVLVAVIDTGVDNRNPQLAAPGKVLDGGTPLIDKTNGGQPAAGGALADPVGHGTKVAGIIAASRRDGVGFVGLAPDADILSIRQNDDTGDGDVNTLIHSIGIAVAMHAQVINISQDVRGTDAGGSFQGIDQLRQAVQAAEAANVVVVASSGNDGGDGPTYPAAFPTVLAVGASDRNNERASFSQYGSFVGVAAPGVDMLSTVPGGGQCVDNGTSFSAPYVAGVAALLVGEHPTWSAQQIRTRIEQTAQRTERGRNDYIGWGVVDPVKAVTDTAPPADTPVPDAPVQLANAPILPQPLGLGETQADRDRRTATYVLGAGALLVALIGGGSVVLRDVRRRRVV
ncbi:type VII secretion-associated serine protease mycosin [Kitasatospora sp. MAP12-15]|uniref:type VII secretion-associated serine protease mycosin n=1 Tax=unclassified Kitasatospora TaxID=2633591 RepID=UPI0024760124|nr:type VII secretion-associated serine protease mycosin [Kitasatospora sp. MAP12-44]MDH6113189.1 type VII secretion-associated serine protease mycosin [Kitasatospora sp. MAP12-44]